MIFKNTKVYDVLKYITLIFLPAVEALWLTLGEIWGFANVTQIGATIAAFTVFLGTILGLSNMKYKTAQSYNQKAIEQDGEADYTNIIESEEVEDNGITIED